ncbi:MAG: hypothetical protein JW797_14745 [Bradymonadales bacterium]|nr:hypothetical protein [Bradymonadales bacterium]
MARWLLAVAITWTMLGKPIPARGEPIFTEVAQTVGSEDPEGPAQPLGIGVVQPDGSLEVSNQPVFVRHGDSIRLGVYRLGEEGGCLSPFEVVELYGRRRLCSPPEESEVSGTIRWLEWRPMARDYDNSERCRPGSDLECPQPIEYRAVELVALRDRWTVALTSVPTLSGLGTHRLEVRWMEANHPVIEELRTLSLDEITRLFELVLRRDDTYVGYLTELLGLPFVYWPVEIEGAGHQTDLRLGADCVALVIYGRRRLGERLPYLAPPALRRLAWRVGGSQEEKLAIRPGDILHFGFQTAVISRDNEPEGQLNEEDLIIHTYHGLAEEVPFHQLPYRQHPFDLLRW